MALESKVKQLNIDVRNNYQELEQKIQQKNMYGMGAMSMGGGQDMAETE